MDDGDRIGERLERLERELDRQRRRAGAWRVAALIGVGLLLWMPGTTDARRVASSLELQSPDGRQHARFTAMGFEYRFDGEARAKFDIGESWDRFTFYRQDGAPSVSLGTDETGASVRLFSADEKLRLELSESVVGLGSGLRLFDETGLPRSVMYSGHHGAATGYKITDANRQPRVEISSQPGGEAMIRTSDSDAQSVVEISVLHESDASFRQLGFAPAAEHDPLVPMVYLLDRSGNSKLIMATTPH